MLDGLRLKEFDAEVSVETVTKEKMSRGLRSAVYVAR